MSLKASNGSHTHIYIANLKMFKEIKVAQDVNATENADVTFLRAIGKVRPIYGYKEINDTPVTGNINILRTDNNDFQKLAVGLAETDTYTGSGLIDMGTIYMLWRHYDIKTDAEFVSTWTPAVQVSSNQDNVPLKGTITNQYNFSASMKIDLPNPAIIETKTVSTGTFDVSNAPIAFDGVEFLPAAVDSDGNYSYFIVDTDTGDIIPTDEWSISGTTVTLTGGSVNVQNVMVAYQYAAT